MKDKMSFKICRGLNCLQCPIQDSACIVLEAQIEKERRQARNEFETED